MLRKDQMVAAIEAEIEMWEVSAYRVELRYKVGKRLGDSEEELAILRKEIERHEERIHEYKIELENAGGTDGAS